MADSQKYFSPLLENAIRLANFWHKDQRLKTVEFPYFIHLSAIASILSQAGFEDKVVAAGYCHDLLQYTNCPEEELLDACGSEVLEIVKTLTDKTTVDSLREWENQKRKYINQMKNNSDAVKAVAVAEKIHNLHLLMEALDEYGLKFFDLFYANPEKKLWCEDHVSMMFLDSFRHPLSAEYNELVDNFVDLLEELDNRNDFTPINFRYPIGDFEEPLIINEENSNRITPIQQTYPELEEIKLLLSQNLLSQQELIKFIQLQSKKIDKLKQNQIVKIIERNDDIPRKKPQTLEINNGFESNPDRMAGRYLTKDEFNFLLPASLQIAIIKKELTNPILQENLRINFTTAHRILKELKRMHIIERADSFKPRKVDVAKAEKMLNQISKVD